MLNASSRKANSNVNNSDIIEDESENNNIDYEDEFNHLDMAEDPFFSIIIDETHSHDLEQHIASYIAAVIEKCIMERRWYAPINCRKCLLVFAEDESVDDEFVKLKMKSCKLLAPARSTVEICIATENAMRKYNYEPGKYNYIQNDVLANINTEEMFWMSNFDNHKETEHKTRLIKLIIEMYTKKKQDYISKCNTLDNHDVFWRSKLKKIVHFKGQ